MARKVKVKPAHTVFVRWLDTVGWRAGWATEEQARQQRPMFCESIGFLVCQDKEYVTISSTQASNGHLEAPMTIPRRTILQMGSFTPQVIKQRKK